MSKKFLLLIGGLTLSTTAFAGGFEGKTMRDPFSNRSIERGLVLGKGWFQLSLGSSYKMATGYWDSDGVAQDYESTSFLYTTEYLDIKYGVTRNVEFSWKLKTHYLNLSNTELGTDTSQFGLGDPEFGVKYQLLRSNAPLTSVIAYGHYKAPMANEMPGNYVGGPNTFSAFVLTTGTPDLTIGLAGKKQLGPVAFTADIAHVNRFSAVASYAIETDLNQFQTRVKPGNIEKLDIKAEGQVGPINLHLGGIYQYRSAFNIGATTDGLFPAKNLDSIEGSDGWSLDARAGLILNIFQELDLKATALVPIRGEDAMFWPLEDVHPTRGNVYNGELVYRF